MHSTATSPPASQSLRPIGNPPGFKDWTIWGGNMHCVHYYKHLLLMGRSLLTVDVLVMVLFGMSHGPF